MGRLLAIVILLVVLASCAVDPNTQEYDCYGAADGGHVCNPA